MEFNNYQLKNRLLFKMFVFFILITQTFLYAQSGSVKGVVYEKDTGEPLAGANVIINGTTLGSSTDLDGKFLIRKIPAGEHTLSVSYIGYNPKSTIISITANRTLELDFHLEPQVLEGETVTVSAQAQGQVSAIQQQLTSDQIANIVSEKRLQELPDFNAASALSRLPGVSTTQSSGEDNKVVIRGLAPKYNAIQVEGIQMAATGSSQIGLSSNPNSGNNSINNDRSVDLTMVSPYMIRTIAVYKSLTPDMNANSIGGTVNMELREAPEETHFDFLYQQGYTAKSNSLGNFRVVGSASSRFFDNKLGVYGLLNAEQYDRNSDNMGANYDLAADDTKADSITGFRPVKVDQVTFNRHLETRTRYGGNLILDYRLPNGSIKFTNLLARIKSDFTEHRQTIDYDTGDMYWKLKKGENFIDQQMHSLKFDYDLGFITTDLSVSYSASSNDLEDSPVLNFDQDAALQGGVLRDNIKPEDLTYLLTEYRGHEEVKLNNGNMFTSLYDESRLTMKADFEIPFTLGTSLNGFFKFGGEMYNQENEIDQETPYLSFSGSTDPNSTDIQGAMINAIAERFGITVNDLGKLAGTWFLTKDDDLFDSFLDDKYGDIYFASNPDLLVDIMNYIVGNPEFDASNENLSSGAAGGWYDGPYQQLTNDYTYKEDYYAGYGMAKINWLDFTLIGGVRYEELESEYFAYNARDQRNPQAQKMYDTTSVTKNDFLLPMAQIKYAPTNWFDVRYAYTQTLSRPSYHSLSPKYTITSGGNGVHTGNPDLKPAHALNHDLNFTFHSNKLGLITIGGFYKTINDFVYTAEYFLDAAQDAGVDHIDNYTIIRDGVPVVEPGDDPKVRKPFNNPYEATVKGIEIDFQHNFWYLPVPFNNIVFGINYARIDSETKYPFYDRNVIWDFTVRPAKATPELIDTAYSGRLIDQPDHVLNAYLGYDYEGFSSRISIRYQDNSARSNGGHKFEMDSYTTENFRLDFSARQKLPWYNAEIFLDVNNITSTNTKWIQRSIEGFRGIQNYGLTANLGVRIRY